MARAARTADFDWNHIPSILKVVGVAGALVVTVFTASSAYYSIIGRMDRFENQQTIQSKTLESLAFSIKGLAEKAATSEEVDTKIERSCLQMQIQNKGWVCPFSGTDLVARPAARRSWPAAEVIRGTK